MGESRAWVEIGQVELEGGFGKALNEHLGEVTGEQRIGNSRDCSFNRDLPTVTRPLALLRTPASSPRVEMSRRRNWGEIGKERRRKKRYES